MPAMGKAWRHVTISTYCSWLKGDPRGFRTRDHDIHSSGDYKHPPPEGEHDGLHEYFQDRAQDEVHIGCAQRKFIGQSILRWCREKHHSVVEIAITKIHAHWLVELPDDMRWIPTIVGDAKRVSSRGVKSTMPGKVWSRGGGYKPVKDRSHQQSTHDYIIYDQGAGAWTWSYLDQSDEGAYSRRRPVQ